jgi:ribosome-binding protein aMBF1 (putative translation factor)
MASGGAGSRGGVSKSTFYRAWRENQLQKDAAHAADREAAYHLHRGIPRANLERTLEDEDQAREAARKAITISCPEPTFDELIERGLSRLRAWREVRNVKLEDLAAGIGISKNVLSQIENGTRLPTSSQMERLAEVLCIDPSDLAAPL